jgi:hypothetical protein
MKRIAYVIVVPLVVNHCCFFLCYQKSVWIIANLWLKWFFFKRFMFFMVNLEMGWICL